MADAHLEERLTALAVLTAVHHGRDEAAAAIVEECLAEGRLTGVVAALTALALIAYRALGDAWEAEPEVIMQRLGVVMSQD